MPTSKTPRTTGTGARKTATTTKPATAKKKAPRKGAVRTGTGLGGSAKDLATLLDHAKLPKERVQALAQVGAGVTADRKTFDGVIRVLVDSSADVKLREEALSTLQGATFDTINCARSRPAYLKALRVLRTDQDAELRQRAFGILAREQDADTQALLIAGLDDASEALLPPEKALQLLSYDPNAGAFDAAGDAAIAR